MNLRNISRVALVLLLPLLLGWSTDASAGLRATFKFEQNPDGGTLKVETAPDGQNWTERKTGDNVLSGIDLRVTITHPAAKEFKTLQIANKDFTAKATTVGNVTTYIGKVIKDKQDQCEIIVTFQAKAGVTHKLNFTNPDGATITVTVDGEAKTPGSDIEEGKELLIAVKLTDLTKQVESVKLNDNAATKDGDNWKATMPNKDANLVVTLGANPPAPQPGEGNVLTIVANGTTVKVMNGTTEVKSGDKVAKDTKLMVEVSAVPSDKSIDKVTLNDQTMTLVADKYEGNMPDAAATLTVVLKDNPAPQPGEGHVLTIVANGTTVKVMNGTTEVKNGDKVVKGTKLMVEVSAVPSDKSIDKVTLNDQTMTLVAGKYEGTMPDAAATLTVVLKDNPAPQPGEGNVIKVTANGATVKIMDGTTEVKENTKVKAGTDLVITVTPPAGKMIENLTFNNTVVNPEADKSYKVKMSATEATLVVNLKNVVAVEDAVLAGVVAYPNPMVRELVVTNLAEVENVALLNAQGVVVRSVKPNGATELRLAVEELPSGIYMLLLERNGARKAIHIVK